jgi:hypothetical protein
MTTPSDTTKGNPTSAQPMAGLSKRAQKLLDPKKNGHFRSGTQIEPQGGGLARHAKTKASI